MTATTETAHSPVLAQFLKARGFGANLSPCRYDPRDGHTPLSAPAFIRRAVSDEVTAGRLVLSSPAAPLPDPDVRRRLREAAGLARPGVAASLNVSRELLRKWELPADEGGLEPQGEARRKYAELLAQWASSALRDAQDPSVPTPEPEPLPVPHGPQPDPAVEARLEARAAAFAAHRERMRPPANSGNERPSFIPGALVPLKRFDGQVT